MIIRCKFTAVPGQQWELRRRVYEALRDLFALEGIAVAVRQVHVVSPQNGAPEPAISAAGAELPIETLTAGSL